MARNKSFRIGRSRTGLGLFATAPIEKRTVIVEYKGRKLTTEEADKLEARGNRYLYELNSRWTLDGTTRRNLGRYANHSCRPNAEAHQVGHRMFLRSIKAIKLGDEITWNYGRDYLLNVITRSGCKCDKCREKRAEARAETRARTLRAAAKLAKKRAEARRKSNGHARP
jgi:SET domain-containing protein